ncbi:hypothetical protein L596_011881 [Steinernema carpocapsae]|uniref:Uncharacterized protein n=1 Tax=Steinernema carpocapsae TaxID=34508 RepID=A0A4U5NW75_STECR|nr:hypothetical protein L596_011881 [Steinernema carpocapsae]
MHNSIITSVAISARAAAEEFIVKRGGCLATGDLRQTWGRRRAEMPWIEVNFCCRKESDWLITRADQVVIERGS